MRNIVLGLVPSLAGVALSLACSDPKSDRPSPLAAGSAGGESTAPPAALLPEPPAALPEGLALTPPMGFNDWNAFGCEVTETLIKETADFFVSSGLKEAGYSYVNIDDCWALRERGADGKLVPDPQKFPSGIQGVADYVHSLGLKLGIYADAGTLTCAGYPGSLGKEELDAQTFADWGVDYLKYDNCSNQSDGSRQDYVNRYTAMRRAIDATGRPMVYSICEWGTSQPWEWATDVGQLWRTTGDITDTWPSVRSIIAFNAPLASFAGPGHWNDPDMLEIGNGGMTDTEYRTHMSLWSVMAAPLIIGTDLRVATPATLEILSNRELIAINQDRLGTQARVLFSDATGVLVLEKPLTGGDVAIALYNPGDSQAVLSIPAAQLGLSAAPAYRLQEAWSGAVTQSASTIAAGVPAHGAVVYRAARLADAQEALLLPPSLSLGGNIGTLIAGNAEGAVLTGSARNYGLGDASDVQLSVSAPAGWTVSVASGSSGESLPSDGTLDNGWSVSVPAGTAAGVYPLTLTARYAWGTDRQPAALSSELSVRVVVPPRDGTSLVSLLVPISASNALGPVEIDASNGGLNAADGNLITLGGNVYTRGLGTNAGSELVYYLGGRCSSLTVDVGIDDEIQSGGSASFAIYADDRLAAESGVLTSADPARALSADLTGATLLRLVSDPVGAIDGDHADWANPRIVCGASTELTSAEQTLYSFETGSEDWTLSNAAAGGSIALSEAFHTEGGAGLQVTSPADGNWFGRTLATPLDLSGKTHLAFDLKTADAGTSGELAVQVGPAGAWCQGGAWVWTNPNSSKTIRTAFRDMACPAGTTLDVAQITAVWVFLKAGTFTIDQLRAEG
ncbi:MAG: hypothetical protein RL685_3765 [Pseudomonadota bacterium]